MNRRSFLKGLALVAGGIAAGASLFTKPWRGVNPAYVNATYELAFYPLPPDYPYGIDPYPPRYELVNGTFVRVHP